jgi:hypothetical protein
MLNGDRTTIFDVQLQPQRQEQTIGPDRVASADFQTLSGCVEPIAFFKSSAQADLQNEIPSRARQSRLA